MDSKFTYKVREIQRPRETNTTSNHSLLIHAHGPLSSPLWQQIFLAEQVGMAQKRRREGGRDQLSIGDHQGALGTLFISTAVPSNSQVYNFIPYYHSKSRMNPTYHYLGCAENTALHFQRKFNRDLMPRTLNSVNEHKIQLDLQMSNK